MEGGDPGNMDDLRSAALKLQRKYLKNTTGEEPRERPERPSKVKEKAGDEEPDVSALSTRRSILHSSSWTHCIRT